MEHCEGVGERLDAAVVGARQIDGEGIHDPHGEEGAEESLHADEKPRGRLHRGVGVGGGGWRVVCLPMPMGSQAGAC